MKTKTTATKCLVKYTPLTRIRTKCTVIDKIDRAIWPKAHELRDKSSLNKRLRFSPDVPPQQGLREGPRGDSAKKDVIKKTFEAVMCMKKTNLGQNARKKPDIFV